MVKDPGQRILDGANHLVQVRLRDRVRPLLARNGRRALHTEYKRQLQSARPWRIDGAVLERTAGDHLRPGLVLRIIVRHDRTTVDHEGLGASFGRRVLAVLGRSAKGNSQLVHRLSHQLLIAIPQRIPSPRASHPAQNNSQSCALILFLCCFCWVFLLTHRICLSG